MNNHDQELLPCPFCGGDSVNPAGWLRGDGVSGPECQSCGATAGGVEEWNRRAQQPASVAVPDDDSERLQREASYYRSTLRNVLKDIRDDLVRGGLPESYRSIAEAISIVLEVAAAPHPVSGEQKPVAFIDFQQMEACRHKPVDGAWTPVYAAPPAAQDVSGLVEALKDLISAVRSINFARRHIVMIEGDDEPCFWQRREWVEWILGNCTDAEQALANYHAKAQGGGS